MPKRSTLRLTIRSIAALPATGKDAFYWDRDLAGFGVHLFPNPEFSRMNMVTN